MEVLNALESVKKGLATKDMIEQTTSFIFSDSKVYAYNDEICAISDSPLDIEGVVDALPLLKLLSTIKDDEINTWIENNEFRIKGKKFHTGIAYEEEIKLPINEINFPTEFIETPKNFSLLAKLACMTASKLLDDALITNVHITSNRIESCDNDRITVCNIDLDQEIDVLVYYKNLQDIVIGHTIKGITTDDTWVHFLTNEEIILSCRIQEEEYVDLEEHLPEDEGTIITLPDQIKEILNRAETFGKNAETNEKFINISIKNKKLLIESRNEIGWHKEKANTKYVGPDISFTINSDFLKDILNLSTEIQIINDVLMFKDKHSTHLVKLEE